MRLVPALELTSANYFEKGSEDSEGDRRRIPGRDQEFAQAETWTAGA